MGFELRFTDQEITAWGGMGPLKRMLDHLYFDQALQASGLPQPGSNRGYRPEQLITQFMLSVWCCANRFEQGEVTRHDPVLKRLLGFSRMANFKAVMRLFRKFSQATNEHVFGALYRWLFAQIAVDGLTLDLDSTVMTRHGTQEGAVRGYNPTKPGRPSHHPLMAFVSDTRMIANCWLRPGSTQSAHNVRAFLDDTLDRLGGKRVALLRADSGFSDQAFLRDCEQKKLSHVIALRLNQPLQRALVESSGWWMLDDGIDLVSIDYQAPSWSQPRRSALLGHPTDSLKGLQDRIGAHAPHSPPSIRRGKASRTASAATDNGTRRGVPLLVSGMSKTCAPVQVFPAHVGDLPATHIAVSMAQVMREPILPPMCERSLRCIRDVTVRASSSRRLPNDTEIR